MSILKLKLAPLILIEDDANKNIIPLVLELTQHEKNTLNLVCYEHPTSVWRSIFKRQLKVQYYEEFNEIICNTISSANESHSVIVDSVNQMSLCLGWNKCLKYLKTLSSHPKIKQVILILNTDCLLHYSKLRICLNHIASAVVSYDSADSCKIRVQIKKSGKVLRTEETLYYDSLTSTLKSIPIIKEENQEEPERPLPENLTTFKIEAKQTEKLEKYKLKLPYMNKINEGESTVYYEPDAVDDWDEEDPDEDLDI